MWPDGERKIAVGELAALITFRLFALCMSAVINTHNVQWKPRKGGVCVANHTTPADAVILSTETAFSLVPEICVFQCVVVVLCCLYFSGCANLICNLLSYLTCVELSESYCNSLMCAPHLSTSYVQ